MDDSRRAHHPTATPSPRVIRQEAARFVTGVLVDTGFRVEPPSPDFPADLLVTGHPRKAFLLKVLAAAAPHHRGGTGSLGLHWMLRDTPADFVALVDLSRSRGWLLPTKDFKERAQALRGGRFHLDWIVVRLGIPRKPVPAEEDFAPYAIEQAVTLLAQDLV